MRKKASPTGGKMQMVTKGNKKVPFFAADGIGKMKKGGVVKRSEGSNQKGETTYEVLGRRVTKEQYDKAAKEMDRPKSKVEEDMDDFAKQAKERARLKKMKTGGMVAGANRTVKRVASMVKNRNTRGR